MAAPRRRVSKSIGRRNVKKAGSKKSKRFLLSTLLVLVLFLALGTYHYREALSYYFSFKSKHHLSKSNTELADARVYQILKNHPGKTYGLDVSQYQGKIDWSQVRKIEDTFPVSFVLIRASAGKNHLDTQFKANWSAVKNHDIIRGAYHYYRPNENSLLQAQHFINHVTLEPGDLPPVLDIENLPKTQSLDSLKVGLKRWLNKVEQHYGVKPIIYTGERYYKDFLYRDFKEYKFWIANYNFFVETLKDDWLFWQFTEKGRVPGINENVDINIYNGTPKMLHYLTIQ
ncbi:MAG: glycoside hydrolase family 25 protein [Flavobacterium sp.]